MTDKTVAGAEDILSRKTLPLTEVEAFGATVFIRHMYADERSMREQSYMTAKPSDDPGGFRGRVLVLTLVDADGVRILEDNQAGDLIRNNSADEIERLFEVACELNGLRQTDVETLEGES